jgi:hypothetical protein
MDYSRRHHLALKIDPQCWGCFYPGLVIAIFSALSAATRDWQSYSAKIYGEAVLWGVFRKRSLGLGHYRPLNIFGSICE